MSIKVKQHGKTLVVEMPLEKPVPSKSGKTLLLASTHGVITTDIQFSGRQIALVANAFVYPKKKAVPPEEEDARQRARAGMLKVERLNQTGI
jgi:hypothetical protein